MTTRATVMETRTASGAATSTGMSRASRGTAMSASPNPKAERISVATKITASTQQSVQPTAIVSLSFLLVSTATARGVAEHREAPGGEQGQPARLGEWI